MILYHGTILNRLDRIVNDGMLKVTDKNNSIYGVRKNNNIFNTSEGYVYLTTSLTKAISFANCAFSQDAQFSGNRTLIIIRIEIDKDLVEEDEDEIELKSHNNDCYRLSSNIDIKKSSFTYLEFDSFQECCNKVDDGLKNTTINWYSLAEIKNWLDKI